MQIFAVDFAPIFGANIGQVGRVGPGGRSAVVERTPDGMLSCTEGYGAAGLFAPAATFAQGYGGQASKA